MPVKQDRKDQRRRRKSLKQTREALAKALANEDGWKRLEGLPDAEWNEAQAGDDAEAKESEGE